MTFKTTLLAFRFALAVARQRLAALRNCYLLGADAWVWTDIPPRPRATSVWSAGAGYETDIKAFCRVPVHLFVDGPKGDIDVSLATDLARRWKADICFLPREPPPSTRARQT